MYVASKKVCSNYVPGDKHGPVVEVSCFTKNCIKLRFYILLILSTYLKLFQCKKVSEYDQEIPQPHTADQQTALRGRATEQYICKTIIARQPAFSSSSG